jgi:glutathione S-transferase
MHNLTALVTLAALLFYFWTGLRVGGARGKYKIDAPATTGHPEFERHFRVQANTGEWMIIFLPSLWLFAINVNENIAAAMGVVWIAGRVLYMTGYVQEPGKRSTGFAIQALATAVLLFGSLGFIVWHMIQPAATV